MKIHHLNCGNMRVYKLREALAVCHCLLIETGDSLVLVDSGIGTADMQDLRRLGPMQLILNIRKSKEDTAHSQIRAMGFSENDVGHIIITHLDMDHTGGIPDFPRAKVHVSAHEYQAAASRSTFREQYRYRREHLVRVKQWATYDRASAEPWYGLECVRGLEGLPEDIILVPLFGHTRGHCGVAVREDGRWLLHAGDAYYDHRQMSTQPGCPLHLALFQRFAHMHNCMAVQVRNRLHDIANKSHGEVAVCCTHDPHELSLMGA
jgi:glyoxylase-like metal-dependent hydrolase (beta-lactamase superfamily II)